MSKTETFRNGKLAIVLLFGLVLGLMSPIMPTAKATASTVVVTTTQVPASSHIAAKSTKKKAKKVTKAQKLAKKKNTVATQAKKGVGVRYRSGGASRKGWDCSGLVSYAYKKAGVKPKNGRWTTSTLKKDKRFKKTSKPQKGDVVYQGRGHMGIYMGKKKGKHVMVSARNPRAGTTFHPVYNWNKGKVSFYTLKA